MVATRSRFSESLTQMLSVESGNCFVARDRRKFDDPAGTAKRLCKSGFWCLKDLYFKGSYPLDSRPNMTILLWCSEKSTFSSLTIK